MRDEERYKLHHGPYYPPKTRRGRRLFDEINGTVVVGTWSDGRICWPRRWGLRSLILCGDLVKAVRRESLLAVGHWWGVSRGMVTKWRKALGVEPYNEGTTSLKVVIGKELSKLRLWERGLQVAHDPVLSTRRAHRRRRQGKLGCSQSRQWTAAEDALLGTMMDRDVADKIGCSPQVVYRRRRILGIPSFVTRGPFVGSVAISKGKMLARRLALGLGQKVIDRRASIQSYSHLERGAIKYVLPETVRRLATALECQPEDILLRSAAIARTVPDDSLLGTQSDQKLARKWKVGLHLVQQRRRELGIAAFESQQRRLIDDSLLGTQPDAKLAAMWGVSFWRVYGRRRQLGIPRLSESTRIKVSAERLRDCRLRLGITPREAATRSGVSLEYYSDLERGRTLTITKDMAGRFAEALNCAVEDFAAPLIAPTSGTGDVDPSRVSVTAIALA